SGPTNSDSGTARSVSAVTEAPANPWNPPGRNLTPKAQPESRRTWVDVVVFTPWMCAAESEVTVMLTQGWGMFRAVYGARPRRSQCTDQHRSTCRARFACTG